MTLGEKATLVITPYVMFRTTCLLRQVHFANYMRDTEIMHTALGKLDSQFTNSVVGTGTSMTGYYPTIHAAVDTNARRDQGLARFMMCRGSFEPFFFKYPALLDVHAAATANLIRHQHLQPLASPHL
jgi:hypothetical protein